MSNDSIDKLADVYAGDEADAKAYQKAQAQTIISQSKQIGDLRKKLEEISHQLEQITIENTRLKALGSGVGEFEKGNDAEIICMVQLALLNNYSMQRELTLEECKKAEIYAKTLTMLKGKTEKKEEAPKISDEELMAALKEMNG